MRIKTSEDLKALLRLIADPEAMSHEEYASLVNKAMLIFRNTALGDTSSKKESQMALDIIGNQSNMNAIEYTKKLKKLARVLEQVDIDSANKVVPEE